MKKIFIAPSVLSADFSNLGDDVAAIEQAGADWVHLDVMDGGFVPAITFGDKLVADIRTKTKLPFDVHLMVNNPERFIEPFAIAGADYITFHLEAAIHSNRIVGDIHSKNVKAGVSIVPSTPVSALECLLPFLDLVLIMTVNPGAGAQTFIEECLEKIKILSEIKTKKNLNFLISVDGGINEKTAHNAVKSGADVLVSGSAFFKADNKSAFINKLKTIC
ncbi:MAG: ribulose-phosphate 3-epimerase [Spirochaetaceae bacterium]|nr:ribulose-phosphate 3-epimerase [Spirochaetaceae bacterium]